MLLTSGGGRESNGTYFWHGRPDGFSGGVICHLRILGGPGNRVQCTHNANTRCNDAWWLTDFRLRIKTRLPQPASGSYMLVFDPDGCGSLRDGGQDIPVDSFLEWAVYLSGGNLLLHNLVTDRKRWLLEWQQEHRLGQLQVSAEGMQPGSLVDIGIFTNALPPSSHVFLNVGEVTDMLGMGYAGKTRSSWIYRFWASWEKYLASLGLEQCLMRSLATKRAGDSEVSDDPRRALRFPAIGCAALLALLARWAFGTSRRTGGVQDDTVREACRSLLTSMVGLLTGKHHDFRLNLHRQEPSCSEWPAQPLEEHCDMTTWSLDAGLQVNLSAACLASRAGDGCRDLQPGLRYDGKCDLVGLLSRFFGEQKVFDRFRYIFAQMITSLGSAIDEAFRSRFLECGADFEDVIPAKSELKIRGLGDHFGDSKHMVKRGLLAYWWSSSQLLRQSMRETASTSMGVDKSRVSGRSQTTIAIVLPSNMAFWCMPQVLSHWAKGGRLGKRDTPERVGLKVTSKFG